MKGDIFLDCVKIEPVEFVLDQLGVVLQFPLLDMKAQDSVDRHDKERDLLEMQEVSHLVRELYG